MATIRRSFVLSFAQRYSALAIQMGAMMVLARILTPAEFGTFAVASAVVTLASVLQDFGVGNYLVKEQSLDTAKLATAYSVSFIIAWPLGLLLFLGSGPVARWYGNAELEAVIAALSLIFFAMPFGTPAAAMMRRDLQFGRLYALGVANAVATVAVSLPLALSGYGAISLAWGMVAGQAVTAVGASLLRPGLLFLRPGFAHWSAVLGFGGQAAAISLLSEVGSQAPSIVAGRMLGFDAAGLLHRATATVHLYRKTVLDGLMPVVLPAFSQRIRSGQSVTALYLAGISYLTAIAWPFALSLVFLADPLIRLLFGQQWVAAVPLVQILAVVAATSPLLRLNRAVFVASNRIATNLKIELFIQPLRIALVIYACFFDLHTLVVALTVPPLLNAIVSQVLLRRILDYDTKDYLLRLCHSLVVSVLAAVPPAAAVLIWGWHPAAPLLPLLAGGLGGGLAWLAAVLILNHPIRHELAALWARRPLLRAA
ncbi:MAG: oligosaccharide flippase family protein [Kiloniellaceae bacterium]